MAEKLHTPSRRRPLPPSAGEGADHAAPDNLIFDLIDRRMQLEFEHLEAVKRADAAPADAEAAAAQDKACKAVCDFERATLFSAKPSTAEGAVALLSVATSEATIGTPEARRAINSAIRVLKAEISGDAGEKSEPDDDDDRSPYWLALAQFRRLTALAELVRIAEDHQSIAAVEGIAWLLDDASRAAGELMEAVRGNGA